jgi:nucleoside-diphosphate-sugar epimerase
VQYRFTENFSLAVGAAVLAGKWKGGRDMGSNQFSATSEVNLNDTIYVENAAEAHVAALDRLADPSAACRGRVYFVTNGEPIPLRDIVLGILSAAGIEAKVIPIPRRVAQGAGAVLETVFRAARIEREPPLTRFVAEQLGTAHWFDIGAAKRDLGWSPRVSIDEGLALLRRYFLSTS